MPYKITEIDPYLTPFSGDIALRMYNDRRKLYALTGTSGRLTDFANGHLYFGFH